MKPSSTYRIQLTRDFGFAQAAAIVPYLGRLGVSHLYLSPIFESRSGSSHGYDSVDPTRVSCERGGEAGFQELCRTVLAADPPMALILDIVPNHLAAAYENPLWRDVLEKGADSPYAEFFDLRGFPIILPVLGKDPDAAINSGELELGTSPEGRPVIRYYDSLFPVTGDPATGLRAILAGQPYELAHWKPALKRINFRRFFDIADLVALRQEDPRVFEHTHRRLAELAQGTGAVDGLRVDHVDGLREPRAYLESLRAISPRIWVEKILGANEDLRSDWPVLGTTGYEFLNGTNELLIEPMGLVRLERAYQELGSPWLSWQSAVVESKRRVLDDLFAADLGFLLEKLKAIAMDDPRHPNPALLPHLAEALRLLSCELSVYRTYLEPGRPASPEDVALIREATQRSLEARPVDPGLRDALLWLETLLTRDFARASPEVTSFAMTWQQLTGPVMAKGFEDTAIYRVCPLIAVNNVGSHGPDAIHLDSIGRFHRMQQHRAETRPLNLNATSTHDTKRSEDVVNRANALSEIPERWLDYFIWARQVNEPHRKAVGATQVPAPPLEWFIYQTLVAAWPLAHDPPVWETDYPARIEDYFIKATREAKISTSWLEPNEEFENALRAFLRELLQDRRFLERTDSIARRASYVGAFNSVTTLVLKMTTPGIPDTYQGTETWDLSLVDPDNRRPVDYPRLDRMLAELEAGTPTTAELCAALARSWRDGRLKLWVTRQLLRARRRDPDLFLEGQYLPLEVAGPRRCHVAAFLRRHGERGLLVAVPRLVASALDLTEPVPGVFHPGALTLPPALWRGTHIRLPAGASGRGLELLSGTRTDAVELESLFATVPWAVVAF